MRSAIPPLLSVRAFEAAARLGSFARAARELGTSPASISYHVRQLERQTGLTLFLRHPQRVTLTASGDAIAGEVSRLFDSLRATFASEAEAEAARLSVSTLPSFGSAWLTPRLGRFRQAHPDLSIDLHLSDAPELLGQGRFDAAVRNGDGRWPGLRATKLFPSLFMPLCSPALRSAASKLDCPALRLDVPLLGRPDWWRLWYAALGRVPPPLAFGTTLAAEYLDIAAAVAGQGVSIGSPILFAEEIRSGRLVPAHPFVADSGRAFWFVHPVAHTGRAKLTRFRDWLVAEAETAMQDVRC